MRIRYKPRVQGFEEIRRSPKVAAEIDQLADSIAMRAGRGYESSSRQGQKGPSPSWNVSRHKGYQGRYRAIVFADTFRAMRDNAKNNTLVKLIGGPGGF